MNKLQLMRPTKHRPRCERGRCRSVVGLACLLSTLGCDPSQDNDAVSDANQVESGFVATPDDFGTIGQDRADEPQASTNVDRGERASATADTRVPTTFEEALAAAGDALIVPIPGGGGGATTGDVDRGTFYLQDKDIVARAEVGALGVSVKTFTRDGGKNRHRVFISSGCELVGHSYKDFDKLDGPSTVSTRCPADYPLRVAGVMLVDLPETDEPSFDSESQH